MSDLKTQRNVAIGVAALAMAFVAGYVISSGGRQAGAPAVAPGSPASVPAAPVARAEPLTEVQSAPPASTPPAAPSSALAAGERRRRPAPSLPAAEPPIPDDTAAAPESPTTAPVAAAPVRRVERVTIPASTKVVLALVGPVSSQTAQVGDEVIAELAEPIAVDGVVVAPAGTRVTGRVTEAQALRKVGGKAILGLAFDRLETGDGGAAIAAAFRREGRSETGKDAATIAAGAAIGTILGNQAKSNDRGKVIGAVVGAAAGTAVASKTEGERVELAAGARLELTLREPVEVVVDR